jgi:HPt (histidine-containing phosphotransfer) domain-containing protein
MLAPARPRLEPSTLRDPNPCERLVPAMTPSYSDDAGAASPSPLDAAALANLARLDPTGANRLVPRVMAAYQASLAQLLAQMSQASERGDAAAIRLAVHTLKSSSASIGALQLSAHCGAVEQAVRDDRLDGLAPMIERLKDEARRVSSAVQSLLTE